jgi:hypothetical protein
MSRRWLVEKVQRMMTRTKRYCDRKTVSRETISTVMSFVKRAKLRHPDVPSCERWRAAVCEQCPHPFQ